MRGSTCGSPEAEEEALDPDQRSKIHHGDPHEGEPVVRVGFGTGSNVWQMPLDGGDSAPIIASTRQSRSGTVLFASSSFVATDADAAHGDSGGPILAADGSILAVASAIAERPEDNGKVTIGVVADACPGLFESVIL